MRLLSEYIDLEDMLSSTRDTVKKPWYMLYRGDTDMLQWLFNETDVNAKHRTSEQRVDLALDICRIGWQPLLTSYLKAILVNQEIDKSTCITKDEWNCTLLHRTLEHFPETCCLFPENYNCLIRSMPEPLSSSPRSTAPEDERYRTHTLDTIVFIESLIIGGPLLHDLGSGWEGKYRRLQTPLLAVFWGFFYGFRMLNSKGLLNLENLTRRPLLS